MKLTEITLGNFKSFQYYQVFNFDIDNGLYFVTGENQVEPNLGANGAGKSALFEAICWCLYGKTSTNLKAGNVVNWENKGCSVMLRFDNGDFIQRDQNPNRLVINDNPVTQEELEKHLGYLGFESFLYSTFISQFSSKFFDLSPADKMVVFSDIMAEILHPWELRSNQAKTRAVQLEVTIRGMERVVSELKGSLHHANQLDYSKQIKEFEVRKKADIKDANDNLKILNENYRNTKLSLADLMKDKIRIQIEQKKFKTVNRSAEFDQLKNELDSFNKKKIEANSNCKSLEREIANMEGTANKVSICPVCKQSVNKSLLLERINQGEKERDRYKKLYDLYEKKTNDLSNKLDKTKDEIDKENKANNELLTQLRILQTTTDGLTNNIKDYEKRISQLKDSIKVIESRENDYLALEKTRQEDIKKFKSAIKDNEDLLGEAKKEFDAYSYWVKGFREIRLLLMIDALKEFEVSINNNLNKFGMGDWNVKLDIDKENKSGTVRKGFAVLVESPSHNGFVPFEVWSGGEMQRLKLAGSLGLMDLIKSKRMIDFGIEIFDESTSWLSPGGISDLVQLLYDRSKENNQKIFLIDHKSLGSYGMFSGTVKIVKNNKGSQIIL